MAKVPRDDRRALYLTLMILSRFSLLPELLDFFGSTETFLSFIDRFGGMDIKIPPRDEIAKLARNVHIYKTLCGCHTTEAINRLADHYGLTTIRIRKIYEEVTREIEELDAASSHRTNRIIGTRY